MIAGLPEQISYLEGLLVKNAVLLDQEWIALIKEARDQGFTKEEITAFFQNPTSVMNTLYTLKLASS
jgi:hypothetical protein